MKKECEKHKMDKRKYILQNRKRLILTHEEPTFSNVQQTGARPNTVFKSVFTNSTAQAQSYSLKTERTSESICGVMREQGFMFGAEAELTLKTPCKLQLFQSL